jgi:hypothetical protein
MTLITVDTASMMTNIFIENHYMIRPQVSTLCASTEKFNDAVSAAELI